MIISDLNYLQPATGSEVDGGFSRDWGSLVDLDIDVVNVIQVAVPVAIAIGFNFKRGKKR